MDDFELGYLLGYASGYDIGYGRAEHDMEDAWIPVARHIRNLGRPGAPTDLDEADQRVRAAETVVRRMAQEHWNTFLAQYPDYETAAKAVAAK